MWARCWRRSLMVSVSSIFTSYVCSPLSDLMRRVQKSGAGASASSAGFTLGIRKPCQPKSELHSMGRASMTGTGERSFMFGNVLGVNEALCDHGQPDQPPAQTAALLSQPEGALKRLWTFFSFLVLNQGCLVSTSPYFFD